MAEMIRTALFTTGRLSCYSRKLREMEARCKFQVFSSQPDEEEDELHYLRFPCLQKKSPFQLIIYDIADRPEYSYMFHYLMKWPGVVFMDSIELASFSRAVSHSADDSWGFRWILGVVFGQRADLVSRLSRNELNIEPVTAAWPLGRAIALRSAATVVDTCKEVVRLEGHGELPPVSVFEKELTVDKFAEKIDKSLPLWLKRMTEAARTIEPVQHPHLDIFAVEKQRVMESVAEAEQSRAMETLELMFRKAGLR